MLEVRRGSHANVYESASARAVKLREALRPSGLGLGAQEVAGPDSAIQPHRGVSSDPFVSFRNSRSTVSESIKSAADAG